MAKLDASYGSRLLKQAEEDPQRLLSQGSFRKIEFFWQYLGRADKLIWHEPDKALSFVTPAPRFAALVADSHPRENAADLLLLGHSYYGHALRRVGRLEEAQIQFTKGEDYKKHASAKAKAKFCRQYAALCIFQQRPQAFELIHEAMSIYKGGNLVYRHDFGECLVIRGVAYFEFGEPEKTLGDLTAALNHLELKRDPTSYYCALHNLAVYSLKYGSDKEILEARNNLRAARTLLSTQTRHSYAKTEMRWVFGLFDFRLGRNASALEKFQAVAKRFESLCLPFELGCVRLDIARILLQQRKFDEVRKLAVDTAAGFRRFGSEGRAEEALALWRKTLTSKGAVTDARLVEAREAFFGEKQLIAA